jgi:acetyl-CoA carboxylase carboxyltransferase component
MYRKGLLILTLLFQKDIDDVIEPKETREKLIAALRAIYRKSEQSQEGNMAICRSDLSAGNLHKYQEL